MSGLPGGAGPDNAVRRSKPRQRKESQHQTATRSGRRRAAYTLNSASGRLGRVFVLVTCRIVRTGVYVTVTTVSFHPFSCCQTSLVRRADPGLEERKDPSVASSIAWARKKSKRLSYELAAAWGHRFAASWHRELGAPCLDAVDSFG